MWEVFEPYCCTTLLPYSEVVELQYIVRNSTPVSRRIATGPTSIIESNVITHKLYEMEMHRRNERPDYLRWTKIGENTIIGRSVSLNSNAAVSKPIADAKLIDEIVEWMATEVKRRNALNHHEAAKTILERLGNRAVWEELILTAEERDDHDGSMREVYRFGPVVLEAFAKLTGKTVNWGKQNRNWFAAKPKQRRA